MLTSAPRVALLESRMSHELARLVERHGGAPWCVPAVRECHELDAAAAGRLIGALASGAYDVAVFLTGIAVSLLFGVAEQIHRRPELVLALRRVTTVCRGPKPSAALRGFGVTPTLTAREAFTAAEVLDALSGLALQGARVLLFHYGERSDTLAETLVAQGATVHEQWLYRWQLPEDTSGLERLVEGTLAGEVDALVVTCQIQFRHVFSVAQQLGRERDLVRALNERVVVAAVGPTCQALLRLYGVDVHVMPDHPKMGPLIVALMRHLDRGGGHRIPA